MAASERQEVSWKMAKEGESMGLFIGILYL